MRFTLESAEDHPMPRRRASRPVETVLVPCGWVKGVYLGHEDVAGPLVNGVDLWRQAFAEDLIVALDEVRS